MKWLALLLLLSGCAGASSTRTSVDVMFRETASINENVIRLTKPALVTDVNGAFKIHSAALMPGKSLTGFGRIMAGDNSVFSMEFSDYGDIDILRTDDKQVLLRAEFGPDGKVVQALLGAENGIVPSGFSSFENDVFVEGNYELLYEGPDVVVGRFDLTFKANRVRGNFRAPRVR
ncbi:MAG: hypothetical protein ACYTDT_11680 [Planctomycetota bacterium]|jgi:hypothetical protein